MRFALVPWAAWFSGILAFAQSPSTPRLDHDGDPLPEGAVARIGSKRFQECSATRVSITADGSRAICEDDHDVRTWDLKSGKLIERWNLPAEPAYPPLFDPYGRNVQSRWTNVSDDGRKAIRATRSQKQEGLIPPPGRTGLWDPKTGKQLLELKVPEVEHLTRIQLSPDGSLIASVDHSLALRLRVWDAITGAHRMMDGPAEDVDQLHFVDENRKLLVHARNSDWMIAYDVAKGKEAYQIRIGKAKVIPARKGKFFLAAEGSQKLEVFDASTGQPVSKLKYPDQSIYTVARELSDDGTRMLCTRGENNAVWDFREGKERGQFGKSHGECGCFGSEGKTVVLAGHGLRVYDSETGKLLAGPNSERNWNGRPHTFGWSMDGQSICIPGYGGASGFTFAAENGKLLRRLEPGSWVGGYFLAGQFSAQPFGNSISRDRPYCAPESAEGQVARGWATMSGDGRLVALRTVHERGISMLDLRSTGHSPPEPPPRVCRDVAVYDRFSGKRLFTHAFDVSGDVAFSFDNRRLAILEPDGLTVLNAASGKVEFSRRISVGPLPNGRAFATGPAFSPDGNRLAVMMDNGTVLVWDVSFQHKAKTLTESDLARLWQHLGDADASLAWQAVRMMIEDAKRSIPYLLDRVKPITLPNERETADILAGLDHTEFRKRELATKRVLDLGPCAKPFIEQAKKGKITAEQLRRLDLLIAMLPEEAPPRGVELRTLRSIAVLEHVRRPEADERIAQLCGGVADGRVTLEATKAAERVTAREREAKRK